MNTNPWRRVWLVGFTSAETHWFLRLFYRAKPGFQHAWLLSPLSDDEGRWIFVDWSLQGAACKIMSKESAERLFLSISQDGGLLKYEVKDLPDRAISRAVVPTSCAGLLRQFLALPPTWAFWHTPASLWCELRERGAEVLFTPQNEPRW